MTKCWVKKPDQDWVEWFPPCGRGCFLNESAWIGYQNRQWAITSMLYPVKYSEEKPK